MKNSTAGSLELSGAMMTSSGDNRCVFAGVDVRATGSLDHERELIQLGVALGSAEIFVSGSGLEESNNDPAATHPVAPAAQAMDAELVRWLDARRVAEQSLLAIGWGVTALHLPFVRQKLPVFCARYLARHTVELDAICQVLAGTKSYGDAAKTAEEWKAMAKRASELNAKIGYEIDPRWDDAGYCALTSLLAWRWFRGIIVDARPASREPR